ncbi:PE family protein, partial [Mycobacterium sp.]|uniref:PE family protein n=1 Tax=Mycobacterium sp. TaxID=1785 RepID=UPI003C758501
MSYVLVAPEMVSAAAANVGRIGASPAAGNAVAAASTTVVVVVVVVVVSAAGDQISAAIAAVFSQHGQGYQDLAGQLATFHDDFVQALSSSATAYTAAEAASANPLESLMSRPIIG